MMHPIHRVTAFLIVAPHTIRVEFEDDTHQVIDFHPVLVGNFYGPLRDPHFFNQVKLDQEVHTLVWPNGADFDPATLHDWPRYQEALVQRVKTWDQVSA